MVLIIFSWNSNKLIVKNKKESPCINTQNIRYCILNYSLVINDNKTETFTEGGGYLQLTVCEEDGKVRKTNFTYTFEFWSYRRGSVEYSLIQNIQNGYRGVGSPGGRGQSEWEREEENLKRVTLVIGSRWTL